MDDAAEMQARHSEALKVLAARALALACAVQERALVAETDTGMAELTLAFHRVSRTMRQCLALEARLARDAEQGAREAARDRGAEVKRRKDGLRSVLTRHIFDADDQCTDDDVGEMRLRINRLESLLDEDELSDDFLALPVDDQIARLRDDLGLADAALETAVSAAPRPAGDAGSGGGSGAGSGGGSGGGGDGGAFPGSGTHPPNSS